MRTRHASMAVSRFMAALCAIIALSGNAAATCGEIPSESDASRGKWFCDTGSGTVIVFVHGLFSNSREAWLQISATPPEQRHYWPSLVLEDPELEDPEEDDVITDISGVHATGVPVYPASEVAS